MDYKTETFSKLIGLKQKKNVFAIIAVPCHNHISKYLKAWKVLKGGVFFGFFFRAKQKYNYFKEQHIKHIELFFCPCDLIFTVLNLHKEIYTQNSFGKKRVCGTL